VAEFVILDSAYYVGRPVGLDARIYLAAAKAWLSGGDPWASGSDGVLFAAPPVSLLPVAPFAWMSPDAFTALIIAASIVAATFVLRRLRLPLWWLLFPPIVEAISVGSLNILVLAALLTRAGWVGVLAKTYAALPLLVLARVRQLAIAMAIGLVTIPFLPWGIFLAHDVGRVLGVQAAGGRSAWIEPWLLVPVAIAALIAVGRKRSAWWSVPVLWPASQFHYSVFALPANMSTPAAAILAVPVPGAPVVAVVAEGVVRVWRRTRGGRGITVAGRPRDTSEGSAGATSAA
jgi:hypothetical protein